MVGADYAGAVSAAIVSAALSGYLAFRMGKSQALEKWNDNIEKRVRELEMGMVEFQTLIRFYSRERRQRNVSDEVYPHEDEQEQKELGG